MTAMMMQGGIAIHTHPSGRFGPKQLTYHSPRTLRHRHASHPFWLRQAGGSAQQQWIVGRRILICLPRLRFPHRHRCQSPSPRACVPSNHGCSKSSTRPCRNYTASCRGARMPDAPGQTSSVRWKMCMRGACILRVFSSLPLTLSSFPPYPLPITLSSLTFPPHPFLLTPSC